MQLATNRMLCILNQVKLNAMELTFKGDSSHKKSLHSDPERCLNNLQLDAMRNTHCVWTEGLILYLVFCHFHSHSHNAYQQFLPSKGQIILKCLLGVFPFLQKTNENKSTNSKDELFRSFLGRK